MIPAATPPSALSASVIPAKAVPPVEPSGELRDAARQFEAIFLRQMLERARASDFGGGALAGGNGVETFTQMRDDRFADIAAETGALGIARMIEMQLARHGGAKV